MIYIYKYITYNQKRNVGIHCTLTELLFHALSIS